MRRQAPEPRARRRKQGGRSRGRDALRTNACVAARTAENTPTRSYLTGISGELARARRNHNGEIWEPAEPPSVADLPHALALVRRISEPYRPAAGSPLVRPTA